LLDDSLSMHMRWQQRLARARHLLESSDLPIDEIAGARSRAALCGRRSRSQQKLSALDADLEAALTLCLDDMLS
jgi:transcriptional regulator GlxA family with amidase domain